MGSFHRDMQIKKNSYSSKAVRCFPRFRIKHRKFFSCLILNLGRCVIAIHTILWKFVYPCETRNADFIGLYGTPHLKPYNQSSHTNYIEKCGQFSLKDNYTLWLQLHLWNDYSSHSRLILTYACMNLSGHAYQNWNE